MSDIGNRRTVGELAAELNKRVNEPDDKDAAAVALNTILAMT